MKKKEHIASGTGLHSLGDRGGGTHDLISEQIHYIHKVVMIIKVIRHSERQTCWLMFPNTNYAASLIQNTIVCDGVSHSNSFLQLQYALRTCYFF